MQLREDVFCRKYRPLVFYAFCYEDELKPLSSGTWLQEYFSFLYGETSMGGKCMDNWSKIMEDHLH